MLANIVLNTESVMLFVYHQCIIFFMLDTISEGDRKISGSKPESQMAMEHDQSRQRKDDEQFAWPWKGVLVNVPTEWKNGRRVGEQGNHLRDQLSQFCAQKVIPLWDKRNGHTRSAIVEFTKDWSGFKNAMDFEYHFEARGCGKRHGKGQQYHGPEMFGWVARADDYRSYTPIGYWLRNYTDLKTIADLKNEEERKTGKLEESLDKRVEAMDRDVQELEHKNNRTTQLLGKAEEDMKKLLQSHTEGLCQPMSILFALFNYRHMCNSVLAYVDRMVC